MGKLNGDYLFAARNQAAVRQYFSKESAGDKRAEASRDDKRGPCSEDKRWQALGEDKRGQGL